MLVDDDPINAEKRWHTDQLLHESRMGWHDLLVSDLVLGEIADDPDRLHREKLEAALNSVNVRVLLTNKDIDNLAREYVRVGIIPERYRDDAIHISFAVEYRLDAIVSWNMAHIVRVRTRQRVREYNKKHGLYVSDTGTPTEVIDLGPDDDKIA